jgi:GNAT superfamily N-acetyltransferase
MRSHEIIDEIGTLPSSAFSGRWELDMVSQPSGLKPLPGSDRLQYGVRDSGRSLEITVWDAKAAPRAGRHGLVLPRAVGILTTSEVAQDGPPLPNTAEVDYIAVDPRYRGQGIAQGMYQVVLQTMQRTLVAGADQTPGGQRAWVTLWRTPGVEVRGWMTIEDHRMNLTDNVIDTLMGRVGADYIGQQKSGSITYRAWSFEVQSMASGRRMEARVKNQLTKIYGRLGDDNPVHSVGMYAVWSGR